MCKHVPGVAPLELIKRRVKRSIVVKFAKKMVKTIVFNNFDKYKVVVTFG